MFLRTHTSGSRQPPPTPGLPGIDHRLCHSPPTGAPLPGETSRVRQHSRTEERNPRRPRRPERRPDDEGARSPDLRDHELRLRQRRPRRSPVRAAGVRQHLHPDHEPDHRRLRAAHRGARGWRRGAGRGVRSGGRDADDPQPGPRRRQHRHQRLALRRHLQPLPVHPAQIRHHVPVRRRLQTRGVREGDRLQDQGRLPRDDRQPAPGRARLRRHRRRSPTSTEYRSSSTTPSRRSCRGRSSGAPTSSSTPPPSGSVATAPRSAA